MPKPTCQGSLRLAFFNSCCLKLKTWIYDLPPELRLDRLDASSLPQAFTLHMVYSTACILLARPYLVPAANSAIDPANTIDTKPEADTLLQTSAKQICSTARRYRRVFGSFRRSPITATHCTLSAALVFLRSSAKTRTLADSTGAAPSSFSSDDVKLCLDVLDELSVSWDTARRIRLNLLKLINKSRTPGVTVGEDSSRSLEDGGQHGKGRPGVDPESSPASRSLQSDPARGEQYTSEHPMLEDHAQAVADQPVESATDLLSASLGFGLEHTLETMIGDPFAFSTDIMDDNIEWDSFLQQ